MRGFGHGQATPFGQASFMIAKGFQSGQNLAPYLGMVVVGWAAG